MRVLFLVLLALAAPARAETPVGPDAFEGMAEGRTMYFTLDGAPFGAEQFLSGRRTLWRFAQNDCEPGRWHGAAEAICFVYDSLDGPICWRFLQTDDGFVAALIEHGTETGFRLDLDRIDSQPLPCPGPQVGS
jgi:hypothetical protein